MWQKCPVCGGTGSAPTPLSTISSVVCSTCNGTKIISKWTGLPPDFKLNELARMLAEKQIENDIAPYLKQYPE